MLTIIVNAIASRERLVINYPPGRRIIEPHAVGYSAEGNILVRAYQTEGESASGEPEHWKLFRLDRFERCVSAFENFDGPREGYKENDRAMKGGIIAQLSLHNRKAQAS